ncbi:MAG: hypothetical protein M1822_006331 [Bathelium mastoideum]|nr:MAG: hypothetical protein M1822_006331 [Bathelium mastoideum]
MADVKTAETSSASAESVKEQASDQDETDSVIEKRILRKLDFRVVPILWLLFLVSFIDRGNIANAKIQGMEQQLHLVGSDYNTAYWVFTLSYVVFGVPANIAFRFFGPKSLSIMMLCWGITVLGQGLTRSYAGLVVCRFLEGACEAGFVPGSATLIGSYYRKDEYLRRYVVFFSASIIAGAFNGLFASLLAKMNGVGGYSGWRWIFIIESLITVVVAVASFFVIIDFPEKVKIFTDREKTVLLARLRDDGGEPAEHRKRDIFFCLKDWKIWAALVTYLAANSVAASVLAFQPTILRGIGYTAGAAQVHSIPVYAVAFVVTITCCFLAEYFNRRYFFAMLAVVLSTIGHSIELAQPHSRGVRYGGMFFVTMGYSIILPITVVWLAINVGKGHKRTVALGIVIAVGNAGNFIGSNVFISSETPVFHTGFSVGMGMTWLAGLCLTILYVGMRIENNWKDKRRPVLDSAEHEGLAVDKHPDFRFKL